MLLYEIMSDLHVGQSTETPKPWLFSGFDDCAFSIIAGDTSKGVWETLRVVEALEATGRKVFFIDGNHEHYLNVDENRSIVETEELFFGKGNTGQVYVPEGCERIAVIGCNGWFRVEKEMPFWERLKRGEWVGDVAGVNDAAERHAAWMDEQLSNLSRGQKALVVTHTLPSIRLIRRKWHGHEGTELVYNPFMEPIFEKHRNNILAWHHGHTHEVFLDNLFGVPVVCNPRGFSHNNREKWAPWICGVRRENGKKLLWQGRRATGIYLGERDETHPTS